MTIGQRSVEHRAGARVTVEARAGAGALADGPSRDAVLAPILGARRDRATTASSARDLLITVLGELVRPNGGAVWTQTLLDTFGLFGIEPKTGRQAIARLGEQGWLRAERVGRRTRQHLTDSATDLLESGADRIYSFGRGNVEWDQRWLVLLVSVPESRRQLRYRLGVGLGWAGFGAIGQGNWISPWVSREPEVVTLLDELALNDATIFKASVGAIGNGPQLAARAWNLDEIRAAYERFIDETQARGPLGDDDYAAAQATADLIELVHGWRSFPLADPDLPVPLLRSDWPRDRAVELFASHHESLRPLAARWWHEIESNYGS